MSFISEELDSCLGKHKLNLSFDIVLAVQKLFKENLTDVEKITIALNLFVVNKRSLRGLTTQQKNDLLAEIFENFINIKAKHKSKNHKKVFDFEKDGEYIYCSFLMDYNIDLIDMQGKLHWKKFIALFQGLSEKTRMSYIMSIRGRDIPEPTKYNQKEIQNLRELKAFYSLCDEEENYQEGLQAMFNTLERMVK